MDVPASLVLCLATQSHTDATPHVTMYVSRQPMAQGGIMARFPASLHPSENVMSGMCMPKTTPHSVPIARSPFPSNTNAAVSIRRHKDAVHTRLDTKIQDSRRTRHKY